MHKNSSATINSIIETMNRYQLSITKEHKIALLFMEPKMFTQVERLVNSHTRPILKAAFNQSFVERYLVLDEKTQAKIQELEDSEKLGAEIEEDDLPWGSESISRSEKKTLRSARNTDFQTKPYRRDNKDLHETRSVIVKQPEESNPLTSSTERSYDIRKQNQHYSKSDVLNDMQFDQVLNSSSRESMLRLLRDGCVMLTEFHRNQLRDKFNELRLANKKGTIEIRKTETKIRNNQANFRAIVLRAYKEKCAITGITITPILEAAHVIPADGDNDLIENALLLSKNMHGLFDRFLISINPDTNKLELSPYLRGKGLDEFLGKIIQHKVSKPNLQWHYTHFKD